MAKWWWIREGVQGRLSKLFTCMEVICIYGIPKVTEEAFIDYFQGCFLTYPYKFFIFFFNWLYFYCTWHIWSETFRRWRQRSLKVKLCGKSFSCAEMSHLLLPGTMGKRNIGLSRHKIVLTCIWLESFPTVVKTCPCLNLSASRGSHWTLTAKFS